MSSATYAKYRAGKYVSLMSCYPIAGLQVQDKCMVSVSNLFYNKRTIADIAMWRLLGWLNSGIIDGIPTSIVDDFPKLKNVHYQVHNHPKVQEWMLKTYGKEI